MAGVREAADALVACAKDQRRSELQSFVKSHMEELHSMKRVMVGNHAWSFAHELSPELFKVYTVVNDALGFTQTFREFVQTTTHVFTAFVKGITYFDAETQPLRLPVIHQRDASCGSARKRFGPDLSDSVRRCLLERLVYDALYARNVGFQDVVHRFELWQMGKIFDARFPDQRLSVVLTYEAAPFDHVPRSLTIRLDVKGVHVHAWSYVKSYDRTSKVYDDRVDTMEIDADGVVRYGTQTFEGGA